MSFLIAAALFAAQAPVAASAPADTPRLVVTLAIDQLFPEQLERLAPHLDGGLGRLMRRGTVFREAYLPYARTETGAGHVTYSTGCIPRSHGVVGNTFWDRELGREQYCVEDTEASAIQSAGRVEGTGRRSPKNMQRPTLSELMQRADAAARVVSISGKDRAAIGMAGAADGVVLWWDRGGTGFQSSDCYMDTLPSFVLDWNGGWIERHRGWEWTDSVSYGAHGPAHFGTAPDDRSGERPRGAAGVTFPYPFPDSEAPKTLGGFAYGTPLVDGFVVDLALTALDEYKLGRRESTDVLSLSFSGCDVCGHQNGPFSREVTDLLVRLDRKLATLFTRLDETVGGGRWVAALSSDHGVLPLPEHLREHGIDGRRVTKDEVAVFRGEFVERLSAELGARVRHRMGPGGLRLDGEDLGKAGIDPVDARAAAARIVREMRLTYDWIQLAYSYEEVAALDESTEGIEAMLRGSFFAARTIDVVIVHRPNVLVAMDKGTSHGSPHAYDRHIPLIFYGAPFPAMLRSDAAGSQDAVPTLLSAIGLQADADFDGRDLFPND